MPTVAVFFFFPLLSLLLLFEFQYAIESSSALLGAHYARRRAHCHEHIVARRLHTYIIEPSHSFLSLFLLFFFFLSFVLFFFSLLFSHSFLVLYSTPTPRYRNQSFIRLIWISICRGWWLGNFVSSSKRYYLRQFVWNFAVAIAAAAVPARRIATQDCVWYMNNSKEHLQGYTWRTKKQIPNKCYFFCWPNVEIRSFGKSRMHTLMSAVAWIPHSFLLILIQFFVLCKKNDLIHFITVSNFL